MNSKISALVGGALALTAIAVPMMASAAPDSESGHQPALTDPQRQAIVGRFAAAVVGDDHAGILAGATSDITWTIPGHSAVSGVTRGSDAVTSLADTFARYGLQISVRGFTFGVNTVAVELHDTGSHDGETLDQDVVNVVTIRDGRVASVDTNLGDVDGFNAYFS